MKAKWFALGLGVAAFFPFAAHFLVYLFSPPPDRDDFGLGGYGSYVAMESGPTEERKAKAAEEDKKQKLFDDAYDRHRTHVFYGVYPLGVLAILLGALSRRQAIGAGFIFGGIFALADGCFNFWEVLPGWASIAAIIFALLVVVTAAAILEGRAATESPP